MIDTEALVKWYGPTLAVDHVSFHVPEGQIVGFLGPNGAGKSTTLRILTGYLPPTAGRAHIAGHDVIGASEQARANIGYLPESTPLYSEMRVDEYLHFRGQLMKMPRKERVDRINTVCDRCGLAHQKRRVIGRLSKGNRQRVGLAQALLHDPPVLILDEPTAGLDPNQIGEVRKLIAELREKHTIMISTHILPEVEKTADRVMIIARGQIVGDGSPEELRHQLAGGSTSFRVEVKASHEAAERAVNSVAGIREVRTEQDGEWTQLTVYPSDDRDLRDPIGAVMLNNQWQVRELTRSSPSLEELFIQVTAEQDRARAAAEAAASA